jgi:3'-phosphoadenosine 5'-phosphosulfate sulfotransferase
VVWSDAKAANILLDRNDDVWVVDFGGGRTSDWVERKLKGTREGDVHALKRIFEEVGGERRDWRLDEKQPTDLEMV